MTIRLTLVFLVVCVWCALVTAVSTQSLPTRYGVPVADETTAEHQVSVHTALAEAIYQKFALVLGKKVNMVLWVKRMLLNLIAQVISYGHYLVINNSALTSEMLRFSLDIFQSLMTSKVSLAPPPTFNLFGYGGGSTIHHGNTKPVNLYTDTQPYPAAN